MPEFVVSLPVKKVIQVRESTLDEIREHVEVKFDDKQSLEVKSLYQLPDWPDGILIDQQGIPDGDYLVILDVGVDGVALAAYTQDEYFEAFNN